jgi:hypothetical protein
VVIPQSQMEQKALSALERERHVFGDPRVVVGTIVTATSLFAKEVFGDTGAVIGSLVAWTGAIVAAGAAWLQTKQHSNLAEASSVAALELSAINDRIPVQSRRGLGTVCQRIRGRNRPRAHAVAGPRTMR